MVQISLFPIEEFERVRTAKLDPYLELEIIADMCRANALAAVKKAGSGHLGSSFSAMDIAVWLYYRQMNVAAVGVDSPERDVYFSSKGHDVPGLYAVLHSIGILPEEKLLKLRRFGGVDGHPDVGVIGMEANSGSLGMGISKGRGIAWAKRYCGRGGRVYVMTGDGEMQEGQNYEGLHAAPNQNVENLTVIVDNNKLQSDRLCCEIMDLGDLATTFKTFGWHVVQADGHDFRTLERVFNEMAQVTDKPKIFVADTIKGRGVSFMEHPTALAAGKGFYKWHAGAPDDASFQAGHAEIVARVNEKLKAAGVQPVQLKDIAPETAAVTAPANALGEPVSTEGKVAANALGEPVSTGGQVKRPSGVTNEYVAEAYGQALVELAAERTDFVVLDGDLAADCRVRAFEIAYPERFIENGIAEQDMVSMAGGMARHGLIPVVNTFASFLAARANEQIYNNSTERSKVVYAAVYAGLIPAGPGKSHQSIRDISLLNALPTMEIIQPGNAAEAVMATRYAIADAPGNVTLRMVIGPSPRKIDLPEGYTLERGKGCTLHEGDAAIVFSYGPVMLHESLKAAELLAERGVNVRVVNMPWLNRVDASWLGDVVGNGKAPIFVVEDHSPVGGLGDCLLNALVENRLLGGRGFRKFAVEGFPACGTPAEALKAHGLDGESLAGCIQSSLAEAGA